MHVKFCKVGRSWSLKLADSWNQLQKCNFSFQVDNYFVAAGMNASGVSLAGGVGNYIAEWIIQGEPSINMWSCDIRRFVDMHNNKKFLRARVSETLGW